jgi:voltage-gated potassium channel
VLNPTETRKSVAYLLFILVVSVLAILLLALASLPRIGPGTRAILNYADTALCVLFLVDFFIAFAAAPRKLQYLATWGWLDLLSSVPMVNAFRVGRLARVVRILRVLRGIRSARIVASAILQRRAQSAFLAACLVTLLLLVFGSIAILQFEDTPQANIKGPGDALWWSVVTLTTVGYGDRYPVTFEGRIVAAMLMLGGVCLFGTLSGFFASWFLLPSERGQENEIGELRMEVQRLREALELGDLTAQGFAQLDSEKETPTGPSRNRSRAKEGQPEDVLHDHG